MVTDKGQHHLGFFEMDGKEHLAALFPFHRVKLGHGDVRMFLHIGKEVLVCAADPAFFVHLGGHRLFTRAEPDFPLQVKVQDRKDL